ncbi:hypothetical protein ACTXT7_006083 [Hymenolepis weldensis]
MTSQPSFEALLASRAARARQEAEGGSDAPSGPNMFMGIDLNQVTYNEDGEATYGGLPGSGAVVLNSVGIVPFPKSKKPIPRDPIPVTQEVREVLIKKRGNFGLTLRSFEHCVFVSHVRANSSAAKAGIRFGDQVLKIEDMNVAGMKGKEAFAYAMGIPRSKVSFIIRDRPLERVVDLMRNDQGHVGLLIVDGEIRQIQGKSSAESNGVVTHSQICEINGVNALGVPDTAIAKMIKNSESPNIRFTIIPREFYIHLTKRLNKNEFGVIHRAKPEPLEP